MIPTSPLLAGLPLRKLFCALISLTAIFSPPRVFADQTWDGGGANNLWSNSANWGLDTLPNFNNALSFSGTIQTSTINDLAADTLIGGINFANTVNGQSFTLGGSRVILGGSITTATMTGGVATNSITDVIDMDLILNGNRTITATASTTHGIRHITIHGIISETGGSFGFTKNGGAGGILTLTNVNTFTGTVTLVSGTISFATIGDEGVPSALGAGGTILAGNSGGSTGTLRYTGAGHSTNRRIQIGSGSTASSTVGVTLSAEGTGEWVFTNTAFNVPFVTSTANRVLTLQGAAGGEGKIEGVIADNNAAGGGTISLTKSGSGSWEISALNSFSGRVRLDQGTLTIRSLANVGTPSGLGTGVANPLINIGSGTNTGTLVVNAESDVTTDRQVQIGRSATSSGGAVIRSDGAGAVTFSNAVFNVSDTTITATNTRVLTLRGTNDGANTIAGVISDNISGLIVAPVRLVKNDGGTWRLQGANTYTGTTTISGGTLDVGDLSVGSLGSGGLILQNGAVLQGNGTFTRGFSSLATAEAGQLTGSSGGFAARGGALFLNFGGGGEEFLLNTGSNRLGSNFVFGSSSADSPVIVINPVSTGGTFSRVLTVNAGVGGDYAEMRGGLTSTGSFTKQGAGLLVLTGTNTVSGSLTINAGTVQVGHPDTNAGTTGTLAFSSIVNDASLVFHRSDTLTYGNVISGSGTVTQAGAGTTVLTGASSYIGTTFIQAGTLQLGNNGATGTLTATSDVVNHGALTFHRNIVHEFSAPISGTGVVNHIGTGVATLLGINSYSGGTSVTAGALVFGNTDAKPAAGTATAAAGATLGLRVGTGLFSSADLDAMFAGTMPNVSLAEGAGVGIDTTAGDFIYSSNIPNVPQGLTKLGPNKLTLTGSNAYTGPTRLTNGILEVGDLALGALSSGPLFFSNNAVLQGFGTFTYAFSGNATTAAAGQLTGTSGGFAAKGGLLTVNFGGAGNSVTLNTGSARFGQNFVFGSAEADNRVLVINPLALGNASRTFTVLSGVGGDFAQIQGVISSSTSTDGVIKAGPGLLVLSGNNTFTGSTTIQQGTLQIGAGGTTGSLNNTSAIINNAALVFTRGSNSTLLISAPISGSGVVNQNGAGVTSLSGVNSYSGGTNVLAGALSFRTTAALPSVGDVMVASGTTLGLGVGAGPEFFTSAQVDQLFAGTFPGITSDPASRVGLDTSAGDFTYSSNVSGSRGLAKLGANILSVTGMNTYTGATFVTGGVLKLDSAGAIPGGIATSGGASNITFNGGVIGLTTTSGDFTRATGSGAGQVRWITDTAGGFAAFGGDRTVNFGGAGASITWSNGGGVFGGGLIFGDADADSTVTMVNPIALNFVNNSRTITVHDGAAAVDAVMAGALSSSTVAGNGTRIIKNGAGTLALTGANQYVSGGTSSGTTVSAGVLQLGNGGTTGSLLFIPTTTGINSNVSISSGAAFAFNRTDAGLVLPNTILGAGQVRQLGTGATTLSGENTYSGGTLVEKGTLFLANTSGSALGSGAVTVAAGATLAGTGSAALLGAASASIAGVIAPGLTDVAGGLGTLTLSTEDGNLTFETGASLIFQIGSSNASDRLLFSSSAGGLMDFSALAPGSISVVYAAGYTPELDDEFDLLDWSAAVGTGGQGLSTDQLSLTMTGFDPSWMWDTSLFTSHGVLRISVVPEPGRLVLILAGVAALLLRRRRTAAAAW